MNYTHKDLSALLSVSDRTLLTHRKTLEERYGVELTVKDGRRVLYPQRYLGLLQYSVNGWTLPETLEDLPAFVPSEPQAENHSGSLAVYEPVTEVLRSRAIAPVGDVIDLQYILTDVDVNAIEGRTEEHFTASKALSAAISKVVLNEAVTEATELKASVKAIYASAIANAKAEVLKEVQNG